MDNLPTVWLLTALLALYYWVQRRYAFFEKRKIPFLKPTFLLGNLGPVIFGKETIGRCFDRVYQATEGKKICGFYMWTKPVYVVRDPQLVHTVLASHFSHFHSHGLIMDEATNPLDGHLFNLEGDKWKAMRSKLAPTFTSAKLKWMFPQIESSLAAFLAFIQQHSHKEIEIRDLLARFTTDVIGSCAFGIEPEAILKDNTLLRSIGHQLFGSWFNNMALFSFRYSFPEIFSFLKIKYIPNRISHFFLNTVRETLDARKELGHHRADFMQLLLELREQGSLEPGVESTAPTSLKWTDNVLAAQAFLFFAAGFETSSTTLSITLYLLAVHPEAQERARGEVKQVQQIHGKLTYDALKEMPFLEACILESARLVPVVEVLLRKCTKEFHDGDLVIPEGAMVAIPVYSLHTDAQIWSNPTEFRPERFLDYEPRSGTYLAFGHGPRICIGRRFALVEAKLCLASILNNFFLSKSPNMKEPIRFEPRGIVTTPRGGFYINFTELST